MTLYKSSEVFRETDELKSCNLLIHLVLTLNDIELTEGKKQSIIEIVAVLKRNGLKSPNERVSEIPAYDCLLSQ